MVEIKLTGKDAEEYLKQHTPDTATLAEALKTATQYIDVLEKQRAQQQFTPIDELDQPAINNDDPMKHNIAGDMNKPAGHTPSSRVLRDTEVAKGFSKPQPYNKSSGTRWLDWELKIIDWTMEQPITNVSRTLKAIVPKFDNRSQAAVISRLNSMGIRIARGVLQDKI